MARAKAKVIASTSVTSAIGLAFSVPTLKLGALAGVHPGKLGIEIIEHGLGRPRRGEYPQGDAHEPGVADVLGHLGAAFAQPAPFVPVAGRALEQDVGAG